MNDSQNQNCSSEDNFICRWESFLDNIVKICKKKIKIKEELFPETNGNIIKLLEEVTDQLKSEEVVQELKKSKYYLLTEDKGEKLLYWIEQELMIINSSIKHDLQEDNDQCSYDNLNNPVPNSDDISLIDTRISQCKDVKDSIEKIFKLPGWLKNVFGVLNELLSLIKG